MFVSISIRIASSVSIPGEVGILLRNPNSGHRSTIPMMASMASLLDWKRSSFIGERNLHMILCSFSSTPVMQFEQMLKTFYEALGPEPTKRPVDDLNAFVSLCCLFLRCIKADQHVSLKILTVVEQYFEQVISFVAYLSFLLSDYFLFVLRSLLHWYMGS